ncbi:hypothetical protein ASZ90_002565 [hydrocarbon metagenome]|uniref:Uncharacterized protein n=1 Tax=hydrocarbon metagenome TaxID=938273 RepID=A0A0W8G3H4_9ZZZZ
MHLKKIQEQYCCRKCDEDSHGKDSKSDIETLCGEYNM